MTPLTELAPAKFNRCLFVGPPRADGRHDLVTVFEPLTLADRLTLEPATGAEDEVVCPGVEGPNLAADALAAFRAATGWDGAPVRISIEKRIPVAAGMGGGSADAAAALRLARRVSGEGDEHLLYELAASLGADVPGQVRPRRVLATGVGERLADIPAGDPYGVLVLPSEHALSTGAVYAEYDRLGPKRTVEDLRRVTQKAAEVVGVNDLERPARSLCPAIDAALADARDAGATTAMVSGSGPTVVGLFPTKHDAERAAERLASRHPAPIACETLTPAQ